MKLKQKNAEVMEKAESLPKFPVGQAEAKGWRAIACNWQHADTTGKFRRKMALGFATVQPIYSVVKIACIVHYIAASPRAENPPALASDRSEARGTRATPAPASARARPRRLISDSKQLRSIFGCQF